MIQVIALAKRYGDMPAVDKVSFSVGRGELFGFIGPNGAGKTTTIKMLVGLIRPTSGWARIGGFDIVKQPLKAKALFGYVPDQPDLYEKLTVREFLSVIAQLYEVDQHLVVERTQRLLRLFGLEGYADIMIRGYSHGMKQKVAIASALIHNPSVLVLDEPLVGLDPKTARRIKDVLWGLRDRGVTILMSTHILEIAERLCDRVGIIDQGKLIGLGTIDELRQAQRLEGLSLEDIYFQLTGGSDSDDVTKFLEEWDESRSVTSQA
jgi:ABC-2 type transport system ATP-binding protein